MAIAPGDGDGGIWTGSLVTGARRGDPDLLHLDIGTRHRHRTHSRRYARRRWLDLVDEGCLRCRRATRPEPDRIPGPVPAEGPRRVADVRRRRRRGWHGDGVELPIRRLGSMGVRGRGVITLDVRDRRRLDGCALGMPADHRHRWSSGDGLLGLGRRRAPLRRLRGRHLRGRHIHRDPLGTPHLWRQLLRAILLPRRRRATVPDLLDARHRR